MLKPKTWLGPVPVGLAFAVPAYAAWDGKSGGIHRQGAKWRIIEVLNGRIGPRIATLHSLECFGEAFETTLCRSQRTR